MMTKTSDWRVTDSGSSDLHYKCILNFDPPGAWNRRMIKEQLVPRLIEAFGDEGTRWRLDLFIAMDIDTWARLQTQDRATFCQIKFRDEEDAMLFRMML